MMVFFFGWSVKATLNSSKNILAVFAIISLSAALVTNFLSRSSRFTRASEAVQISNMEKTSLNGTSVLISFKTSIPVILYLSYHDDERGDDMIVLPSAKLEKKTTHEFTIEHIGAKGGEISAIYEGKRYLFDENTIKIK